MSRMKRGNVNFSKFCISTTSVRIQILTIIMLSKTTDSSVATLEISKQAIAGWFPVQDLVSSVLPPSSFPPLIKKITKGLSDMVGPRKNIILISSTHM